MITYSLLLAVGLAEYRKSPEDFEHWLLSLDDHLRSNFQDELMSCLDLIVNWWEAVPEEVKNYYESGGVATND